MTLNARATTAGIRGECEADTGNSGSWFGTRYYDVTEDPGGSLYTARDRAYRTGVVIFRLYIRIGGRK